MTKQYDNTNKGVLFKNAEKESDKHPDYNGSANLDGVEYFMDAWINEAESGRKYMSFRFKKKEKQGTSVPVKTQAGKVERRNTDMDDDIPF
jgi:uncharacterized protein (DUF736 family)